MERRKGSFTSRRTLLKWGLCGLGTVALTTLPERLTAQTSQGIKTLTFSADDFGILNFALLLEELEAAFYVLVLKSYQFKLSTRQKGVD